MRRLPIHILLTLVLAASFFGLSSSPAFAALTSESVKKVLKEGKLFGDASKVSVACSTNQVVVSTYREHNAGDRDCKIDTVLAMRKIMQADPKITRLTVRFYDLLTPHDYRQVEVRQSDVAAFAGKLINDDKLLSGISITGGSDLPQVVPGPFGEERAAIKQHIGQLQAKGVGIAAYLRLFSEVEELTSKADAEAKAAAAAAAQAKPADKPAAEGSSTPAAEGSSTAVVAAKDPAAASPTMDNLRTSLNSLLQKLDEQEQSVRHIKQTEQTQTATGGRPGSQPAATAPPTTAATTPPQLFNNRTETLGRFVPCDGPYLLDRLQIARKLSELNSRGQVLQTQIDLWRRMDAAANQRKDSVVKADVDYLVQQLGIPPITDAQRQSTQLMRIK